MTIQCVHCKITWRGKKGMHGGRSRVVETRVVAARTQTSRRVRKVVRTVQRIRECLTCRYRWKTREIAIHTKKRKPHEEA